MNFFKDNTLSVRLVNETCIEREKDIAVYTERIYFQNARKVFGRFLKLKNDLSYTVGRDGKGEKTIRFIVLKLFFFFSARAL